MVIQTVDEVNWRDRDTSKKTVYAEVISSEQFLKQDKYRIRVREWVEDVYYDDVVDDVTGDVVNTKFTKETVIYDEYSSPYDYATSDSLRATIKANYPTDKKDSELEAHYLTYGHLIVNNMSQVRGSAWKVREVAE